VANLFSLTVALGTLVPPWLVLVDVVLVVLWTATARSALRRL